MVSLSGNFQAWSKIIILEKNVNAFFDHYIVSNYGILTGFVNYTAEKFGLKSADLDVVARNRLLKNPDFKFFLQDLLPASVQEVRTIL